MPKTIPRDVGRCLGATRLETCEVLYLLVTALLWILGNRSTLSSSISQSVGERDGRMQKGIFVPFLQDEGSILVPPRNFPPQRIEYGSYLKNGLRTFAEESKNGNSFSFTAP
ncbi:hypothetical protein AVEN_40410-1 [Araneus ventricosus]|uniref:Uncharacterized protein n=1 Tax=Araneus ventricosus TaxID=182803 RepID=A0A4Y2D9U4_ARAVE|nr:hypothetical protein AVEN_40410-1 [Araneus ventricosus]